MIRISLAFFRHCVYLYVMKINFILHPSFQGDVIVSFDDVHVGSEGTVPFRSNERIAFRYLISQK